MWQEMWSPTISSLWTSWSTISWSANSTGCCLHTNTTDIWEGNLRANIMLSRTESLPNQLFVGLQSISCVTESSFKRTDGCTVYTVRSSNSDSLFKSIPGLTQFWCIKSGGFGFIWHHKCTGMPFVFVCCLMTNKYQKHESVELSAALHCTGSGGGWSLLSERFCSLGGIDWHPASRDLVGDSPQERENDTLNKS